jgi:hypothetical protein
MSFTMVGAMNSNYYMNKHKINRSVYLISTLYSNKVNKGLEFFSEVYR